MRKHGLAALIALLALSATVAVAAGKPKPNVRLLRDRWGVGHVFAPSDEAALYGLGHLTAHDRGFQMNYSSRMIRGQLAELLGPARKTRRRDTAIDHDLKMRTFGFARAAETVAAHLDADTRDLLDAYCRGVNDAFAAMAASGTLHPLFAKLGVKPRTWTPADCILAWWHLGQFFATDGTRDLIAWRNLGQGAAAGAAGRARFIPRDLPKSPRPPLPPDDAAAVVKRGDVAEAWIKRTREFAHRHGLVPKADGAPGPGGPKFSHAWVVGRQRSTTGSAILVSDPQTPVRTPSLFYEFHVCGKTFNARGIGMPGSPALLIGFTQKVAWGLTALGADQADLFRLKTDPKRPDEYLFDGQWRKMDVRREVIKIRGQRSREVTIRTTHLGPVVTRFAFSRPGEGEVALRRIPVCEPDRETIQGAIAMLRAQNVAQFSRALTGWRFPSVNIVFADSKGDIGYWTLAAIPVRSKLAPHSGRAAHDGTAGRFEWQTILPYDLLPQVLNPKRGVLLSGNHRAIESFYPIPIGAMTGAGGDTVRSWRLREMLAGKERFSPADVLAMHRDSVNPARRELVRLGLHLQDVLKKPLKEDTRCALAILGPWYRAGAKSSLAEPGGALALEAQPLFRMIATDLARVYGGGLSGLSYWCKTVKKRLDADPKAAVSEAEQHYVEAVLGRAWASALAKYRNDPDRWDENARKLLSKRKLGYFETLDGFASLDANHDLAIGPVTRPGGSTIGCQTSQAYTQFVPMHDPDQAMTILPTGASDRPDSPWRKAAMKLWQSDQLHPAPLSREAVERIAVGRQGLRYRDAAAERE